MSIPFLDTNVFLRHLLNDDPVMSRQCFDLIQAIEQGRQQAWTTNLVVAEIVFVLSGKRTYNLAREDISAAVLPLLMLPGLGIDHKRLYPRIFEFYTSLDIDYVDCYHAALVEHHQDPQLYSYDKHFDRIPTVHRLEP